MDEIDAMLAGAGRSRDAAIMGATFAEKVLARNAGRDTVTAGEVLDITPDVVLSHDNTAAISKIFRRTAA